MSSSDRTTAETVIVLLGLAVFLVVVILTIGLVIEAILPPEEIEPTRLINWLTSIIDTIIGALIGFVAGAGIVARRNGNGGS